MARIVMSLSPQIGTKVSFMVPFIALIIDNCIGSGGLLLLKQAVTFSLLRSLFFLWDSVRLPKRERQGEKEKQMLVEIR